MHMIKNTPASVLLCFVLIRINVFADTCGGCLQRVLGPSAKLGEQLTPQLLHFTESKSVPRNEQQHLVSTSNTLAKLGKANTKRE